MAEAVQVLQCSPSLPLVLNPQQTELVIDSEQPLELTLHSEPRTCCSLLIRIVRAPSLSLRSDIGAGSQVTLLYWNQSEEDITIREHNEVGGDALLKVAYGHLSAGQVRHHSTTLLTQPGAQASLHSAVIARTVKELIVDCVHQAPQTEGNMENYGIILKGGSYRMEATGQILRGARGAKSHQASRALTFDEKQTATILPKLLIDENEVEASHATSLGQMDEDQMMYLQSRGLSRDQAVMLVTAGYLMPIAQIIDDEALQQSLRQEIETKVNEVCSMSGK